MKKITLLVFALIIGLTTISCKKEIKKDKDNNQPTTEIGFSLDTSTAKIEWTAYKTTEKIAVKGEFTKISITNAKTSKNVSELINGIEFSIPVSSIFSNNEDRDNKLQKFFFGVMDNTQLLSGKITITDDKTGSLAITMNAMTNSFPISYTLSENEFSMTGVMNLEDWNGQAAIESLNKACFDLHKAADGISKTWNDVQIDARISFKKN